MNQIQLMQICESLQPGKAINISRQDMYDCARGDLSSLLFCSLNKSDVEDFIKKIETNWEISITENPIDNSYRLLNETL